MREIKFRAWDKRFKKFDYGSGDLLLRINSNDFSYPMQYIGLKDKNGKEIYEGDILSGKIYARVNDKTKKVEDNWVIDYYDGAYWLNSIKTRDSYNDKIEINIGDLIYCLSNIFEVVGNIYENPELLKDKE